MARGKAPVKKVLVVDDESSICEVMREFLERKGCKVRTASSCDEALVAYRQERPDIVLLDVRMPGKDGIETLRELKACDADANVIMFTALYEKDLARRALAEGALDYTPKVITPNFLEFGLMSKISLFSSDL